MILPWDHQHKWECFDMDNTPLKKHRKKGRQLVPPFVEFGISGQSWKDDRLPEMLWASLLFTDLERGKALTLCRTLAQKISSLDNPDNYSDVTLTGLALIPEKEFLYLLGHIFQDGESKGSLAPLLLLDGIPGATRWQKELKDNNVSEQMQWNALGKAVLETIDHQSEVSTDCRWVRLLCKMMGGKFRFPEKQEMEIINFPNMGDLREVRPSIRANEMMVDLPHNKKREWPALFWKEVWGKTRCDIPNGANSDITPFSQVTTTRRIVEDVYAELCEHMLKHVESTGIEVKTETVFGMGLYALAVTDDVLASLSSERVLGRFALRTIVEIYITLKYLLMKDDDVTWVQYRDFGSGQAKLAKLKSLERGSTPNFLDMEKLEFIANEDKWEEFLAVNVGHWENTDLRSMAMAIGEKLIYDTYYEWASTYSHAHWGAIREHCFNICFNPLHRGHRVPSFPPNILPDATPDIAILIDKLLDTISNEFPVFPWRISIYRLA